MHAVMAVGDTIRAEDARILIRNLVEGEVISPEVGRVTAVAISDAECDGRADRDAVRARRLKKMLLSLSD